MSSHKTTTPTKWSSPFSNISLCPFLQSWSHSLLNLRPNFRWLNAKKWETSMCHCVTCPGENHSNKIRSSYAQVSHQPQTQFNFCSLFVLHLFTNGYFHSLFLLFAEAILTCILDQHLSAAPISCSTHDFTWSLGNFNLTFISLSVSLSSKWYIPFYRLLSFLLQ